MSYDQNKKFPGFLGRNQKPLPGIGAGPVQWYYCGDQRRACAGCYCGQLEIRLIETACLASYHAQERGDVEVMKAPDMAGDGEGWLIIDDLVDTGNRQNAAPVAAESPFATVYAKPKGRPVVDTFITEVSQDTWIFFPWDLEPRPSRPIADTQP